MTVKKLAWAAYLLERVIQHMHIIQRLYKCKWKYEAIRFL